MIARRSCARKQFFHWNIPDLESKKCGVMTQMQGEADKQAQLP
jgi:hypothetical protein